MNDSSSEGFCVRDQIYTQVRNLQLSCRRLFEAIDALASGRTSIEATLQPENVVDQIIENNMVLRKMVDKLVEHQKLNAIIVELKMAVRDEDAKIDCLASRLRDAENTLQDSLDVAKPRISSMQKANKGVLDVDEIIAYANKISSALSAPPNWDPTQPLGNHLPPAPPDDMMRSGKLVSAFYDENQKEEPRPL